MRLNTKSLLKHCGFNCKSLVKGADRLFEQDARAVFITPDTIMRSRNAAGSRTGMQNLPDVKYGDILISRQKPEGGVEGLHIPAGKDAALLMDISTDDGVRKIPFTGRYMLQARQKALALISGHKGISQDQKEILKGIQGTFEIIAARPDPARYSEDLIGQSYMCALVDRAGRIEASVTDAQVGRKARADLIRAQISRVAPDHPEGLMTTDVLSLEEFLEDAGIQTGCDAPGRKLGNIQLNEKALRGMISSNKGLMRDVFRTLTSTSVAELGVHAVSSDEYEFLIDEYQDKRLTGGWIDKAGERMKAITGQGLPDYVFEMNIFSIDNLDIMMVRDSVSKASGQAFIYSWPLAERLPLARVGNTSILNVSPEEIPDNAEISRLRKVLDGLSAEQLLDNLSRNPEEMGG